MSEISIAVSGRNVITVRLQPEDIYGRDLAGEPALGLRFRVQLLPAGQQNNRDYALIRFAGNLQGQGVGELASFEISPLEEVSNVSASFFRQLDAVVQLSRRQIRRFEAARAGKNANLQIRLSGLVWYTTQPGIEVILSGGNLQVMVPTSQWVDQVLSVWGLLKTRIIEVDFPDESSGDVFRDAYGRIEEAEKQFANGQYKHVLTSLRLSFEGLAKGLGSPSAGKDFFESLFASAHPDKREKARDALTSFYRFLHLGPHEHASASGQTDQWVVTREDARFALIIAQAIFEYLAHRSPS